MNKRILVIRFSSLGDIILTTPVLRALRKQYPRAEIHFLTKAKFKEAIEHHPVPDKIIFLKESLAETVQWLQEQRYDMVIDLHDSLRSLFIRFQLNAKKYVYPKGRWKRWLYLKTGIGKPDQRHIVQKYMAALKPLGMYEDEQGLDFRIDARIQADVQQLCTREFPGRAPVAIVLSATWYTKKMPAEKYIRFLQSLNAPFVLLGGTTEQAEAEQIMSKVQGGINLCGKTSLQESAAWLKLSSLVVTHDTGLMHIAAALQKITFVIWGNTVPELGMYPWKTEFYNFEIRNLDCRPCTHLGYPKCPKAHFACMNSHDPDKMAEKVGYILQE